MTVNTVSKYEKQELTDRDETTRSFESIVIILIGFICIKYFVNFFIHKGDISFVGKKMSWDLRRILKSSYNSSELDFNETLRVSDSNR